MKMRVSKIIVLLVGIFLSSAAAQATPPQLPPPWVSSLNYHVNSLGLDFIEPDNSPTTPSVTYWAAFNSAGALIANGNRIIMSPQVSALCAPLFGLPNAFFAQYNFGGLKMGTRIECAFSNVVIIDLTPIGQGIHAGTKF